MWNGFDLYFVDMKDHSQESRITVGQLEKIPGIFVASEDLVGIIHFYFKHNPKNGIKDPECELKNLLKQNGYVGGCAGERFEIRTMTPIPEIPQSLRKMYGNLLQ